MHRQPGRADGHHGQLEHHRRGADTVHPQEAEGQLDRHAVRRRRDIPWWIKGNTIGKNLTIIDVTAEWLGVQFNTISGNAVLIKITVLDAEHPGGKVAVVENTVWDNLICFGTRARRVPRLHPRRDQPRRSPSDSVSAQRSVHRSDLTS